MSRADASPPSPVAPLVDGFLSCRVDPRQEIEFGAGGIVALSSWRRVTIEFTIPDNGRLPDALFLLPASSEAFLSCIQAFVDQASTFSAKELMPRKPKKRKRAKR